MRLPDRYTILVSQAVPSSGGNTEFCNTYAAWEELPEAKKLEIGDLIAVHDSVTMHKTVGYDPTDQERSDNPPTPQPLVLTNPLTQRRSLYLSYDIAGIQGMAATESTQLVESLIAHSTSQPFVYEVEWRSAGTLVVWDNRATMHRGRPHPDATQPRALRRCSVVTPGVV
jgi:alpha-ketoglutarate-dependent 2,4-dichlorophenoxyacetate dioxygenase